MPLSAAAQARIAIPEGIYYHRFASISRGVEAIWINPAGLSAGQSIYLQYINEFEDGDFIDSRGYTITGEGIGISYRSLEEFNGEDYREFLFGIGTALFQGFHIGFSYRYIKDGYGLYNKRHFWNGGIMIEKYQNVRLGAVFSNLNRGKVNGERSEIEQLYSISYLAYENSLILSGEVTFSGSESFSDARYRFGAEFRASPRVRIFGMVDEDKFFQLGLRIGLGQYYGGLQSRFDSESDHDGSSLYGGVSYLPRR